MQEATHRAKAAVEDARDQVKEHMSELQSIETKLQAAREQNVRPDRAEIEALEARLKEIQLSMSQTVEAASKEVAEVRSFFMHMTTSAATTMYIGYILSSSKQGQIEL